MSSLRRREVVPVLLLAICLAACRAGGGGERSPNGAVPRSAEALAGSSGSTSPLHPDAELYASEFRLSVEEASRRLYVQDDMEPFEADLRSAIGERYAGAWLEHTPEFRYVVRVVGPEPVDADLSGWPLPVMLVYDSAHSYAELRRGLWRLDGVVDELYEHWTGTGLSVQTNSVVVYGTEPPGARVLAELERISGVRITPEEQGPAQLQ